MIHNPEDFEIIDAHTHPFLDPADCIGSYGHPCSMDSFDFEMKKVGIRRYCGSVLTHKKPVTFEVIQELNRTALRIRDRYPGYIPGIHVHGDYPEESCRELHEMAAQGVRWVGELVPYFLGTGLFNTPGMMTILAEAEKLRMTVNLHNGLCAEVTPALEKYPDLKVVLAHPGEPWGEETGAINRFLFMKKHKNLYMDISGYGLFRWNMLRYGIDTCGVDRFLFGSDMPTCSAGMYLFGTLSENLTDEEFRLVFAGNFKRLTGIE